MKKSTITLPKLLALVLALGVSNQAFGLILAPIAIDYITSWNKLVRQVAERLESEKVPYDKTESSLLDKEIKSAQKFMIFDPKDVKFELAKRRLGKDVLILRFNMRADNEIKQVRSDKNLKIKDKNLKIRSINKNRRERIEAIKKRFKERKASNRVKKIQAQ